MKQTRSAVECEGLSKYYGDQLALDDVTLSIFSGQVTGLLGPNGAGKTTLIRIVTTILAPTAGSFRVMGMGPSEAPAIRASIGVMPESAGYPQRKRALDLLTHHGMLYGATEGQSKRRAVELLSEVGLRDRMTDHVGTYSRGMRQRLGLARALMNHPSVLILDEPTLGLDPAGQRDILDLVDHLASARDVAVLLSSHLLEEIQGICDRAVILDRGRVVFDAGITTSLSETFRAVTT